MRFANAGSHVTVAELGNARLASHPVRRASNGIAYRMLGEGPPLLLLHGGSGSWLHWWRNIEALSARHQVMAIDLPGLGDSDDVPPDILVEDYIDRVVQALRESGNARTGLDILAFSFGGFIGAGVAAQLGAAARRVMLISPSGFAKAEGRQLGRRHRSTFAQDAAGERDYLKHLLLSTLLADENSVDEDAITIQRVNMSKARFQNANANFSLSNRLPEFLSRIHGSLMLVYGDFDRTAYPSVDARIETCREVRPDILVQRIPGAGHWSQFEKPADVNALADRFFAGANRDTR